MSGAATLANHGPVHIANMTDALVDELENNEDVRAIVKDISPNKGYYANEASLVLAHPTGENGDFAFVGAPATLWNWVDTQWVDTGTSGNVTSVNTQTGDVVLGADDVGAVSLLADEEVFGTKDWKDKQIFNEIQFETNPVVTATSVGKMNWDSTNGTVSLSLTAVGGGNDVSLQIGQEEHIYAKNTSGVTIHNGDIVRISGASGNRVVVAQAQADTFTNARAIAVATHDVGSNEFGYFTTFGKVGSIDTNAYTEGTSLYLSGTSAGDFTSTIPDYPLLVVRIGIVTNKSINQGSIHVSIEQPWLYGDASNNTQFDKTGHMRMQGDGRPWRDELGDVLSLQQSGPGVSRNLTENVVEFTTSANLSDYMVDNVQLNHDRDESSVIMPHIHYFQDRNAVPNFLLQYRWQKLSGAKTTGWTNLKCNSSVFTYVSGTIHQIATTAAGITPPVGSTISDIVQFRILRDNANTSTVFAGADPFNATVGIMSFDVHVQINSVGSTELYLKG